MTMSGNEQDSSELRLAWLALLRDAFQGTTSRYPAPAAPEMDLKITQRTDCTLADYLAGMLGSTGHSRRIMAETLEIYTTPHRIM
jgi:hypothetical protein